VASIAKKATSRMTAKFLLRFDDLCPAMNWDAWHKLENVMMEEGVNPILAVIPDNQDVTLNEGRPNERFWDHVRAWQARGWTIGLHGYQHRYVSKESGIIGLNRYSEFAGLPLEEQYSKLKQGLEIFAREGVRADVWVAPAHSFDQRTVKALMSLGLKTISDGLSLYPYRDSQGIFWVPQQLWRFRAAPFGVWTICIHPKEGLWVNPDLFRKRIREYRESITDLGAVQEIYKTRKHTLVDSGFKDLWSLALRVKAAFASRAARGRTLATQIESEPTAGRGLNAVR
jgi:predicted deacetylase